MDADAMTEASSQFGESQSHRSGGRRRHKQSEYEEDAEEFTEQVQHCRGCCSTRLTCLQEGVNVAALVN